jgi:hypothetical protein
LKLASNLLLIAGWAIVVTAIVVLPVDAIRGAFVVAGVAVELFGLVLLLRAHRWSSSPRGGRG